MSMHPASSVASVRARALVFVPALLMLAGILPARAASGLDGTKGTERVIVWGGAVDPFFHALHGVAPFEIVYRYRLIGGAALALPSVDSTAAMTLATSMGLHAARDHHVQAALDRSTKTVGVKGSGGAWDLGYSGKGVSIAVIDTGIDATHRSLDDLDDDVTTSDPKVVAFRDFTNGGSPTTPTDGDGHGSHVAGIIAGTGQGSLGDGPRGHAYTGVAYEANIVGLKALSTGGSGLSSNVIAAIDWAATNANAVSPPIRVLNISASSVGRNDGTDPEDVAIDNAAAIGLIPVVAAGNGTAGGAAPNVGSGNVGIPGDARSAITVCSSSATDPNTFSNWDSTGPTADGRVKPDVCAPGESIRSVAAGTTDGWMQATGTSAAAAHVAGIAALIVQAVPQITPEQAKAVLQQTASRASAPDNDHGWGEALAQQAIARAKDLYGAAPQPFVVSTGGPYASRAGSTVDASARATGGLPPYALRWDTNDDGAFDDAFGPSTQIQTGPSPARTIVRVRAVDSSSPPRVAVADTIIDAFGPVQGWTQFHGDVTRAGLATGSTGGTPQILRSVSMPGPVDASPLLVDTNGDGILDIVAASDVTRSGESLTVRAFRQTDIGTTTAWTYEVAPKPSTRAPDSGVVSLAAGDLDGDGVPEIVVNAAYPAEGSLVVLDARTGAARGHIDPAVMGSATAAPPAIADVDGDGMNDIVIVHQSASGTYGLLGAHMEGSALVVAFDTPLTMNEMIAAPAIGELRASHAGSEVVVGDGAASDGTSDIWLCTPTTASAHCAETTTVYSGVRGIALADLDADGHPEIVVNSRTGHSLAVIKGSATPIGGIGNVASHDEGYLWNTPLLSDVDGDSQADIINVQSSGYVNDTARSGDVSVRGFDATSVLDKGTLARMPQPGSSLQSPGGGALVDVDADGIPELVFGSGDGTLVAVRLRNSSRTSPPSQLWSIPLGATPVSPPAAGDVTGDGRADVVIGTVDGHIVIAGARTTHPSAPATPRVSASDGAVRIDWDAPADDGGSPVSGFRIYRDDTMIAHTSATARRYTDTAAVNGQTYDYRVAGENADGPSARSAPATAHPTGPRASLILSASSVVFGDVRAHTQSASRALSITNNGAANLSIGALSIGGADPVAFAVVTDHCSNTTIVPGASCVVDVAARPPSAGARTARLAIPNNATDPPQGVALSTNGVIPVVVVSPSAIDFGTQNVGASGVPRALTISNHGTASLTVSSLVVTGPDFSVTTDSCTGVAVAPGASCDLSLAFVATAEGARAGSLDISSDADPGTDRVTLAGTGLGVPGLVAEPSSIDFGPVFVGSASNVRTVALGNTGTGLLTIGVLTMQGANVSDHALVSNGCNGRALARGETCTFGVLFRPQSTGARDARVSISSDSPSSPYVLPVHGEGVTGTVDMAVTPGALAFGKVLVGATARKSVTIKNTGTAFLNIASMTLSGAPSFTRGSDLCTGRRLAARASCTVSIQFKPSAAGAVAGHLDVATNGSTAVVQFSGAGLVDVNPPVSGFNNKDAGVAAPLVRVISGFTTDDLTGVKEITLSLTPAAGSVRRIALIPDCDAARATCTWRYDPPATFAPGPYAITASGTDFAGNAESPGASISLIIA